MITVTFDYDINREEKGFYYTCRGTVLRLLFEIDPIMFVREARVLELLISEQYFQ